MHPKCQICPHHYQGINKTYCKWLNWKNVTMAKKQRTTTMQNNNNFRYIIVDVEPPYKISVWTKQSYQPPRIKRNLHRHAHATTSRPLRNPANARNMRQKINNALLTTLTTAVNHRNFPHTRRLINVRTLGKSIGRRSADKIKSLTTVLTTALHRLPSVLTHKHHTPHEIPRISPTIHHTSRHLSGSHHPTLRRRAAQRINRIHLLLPAPQNPRPRTHRRSLRTLYTMGTHRLHHQPNP